MEKDLPLIEETTRYGDDQFDYAYDYAYEYAYEYEM